MAEGVKLPREISYRWNQNSLFSSYLCRSTPHCARWWSGTLWGRRPDGAHNGSRTAFHLSHTQVYNVACSGPNTCTLLDQSHGWPHSVDPSHNTCVHTTQYNDCVPEVLQNNKQIIFLTEPFIDQITNRSVRLRVMTKLQDVFKSVSVWVQVTPKPDLIVQNDLHKSFFFFFFIHLRAPQTISLERWWRS